MALKHSAGLRNYILDNGMQAAFDGGTGRINVYSGSQPATPDTAASGTLLGTLTLSSDAFAAAASGGIALNAVTSDTSVDATATAGWFRFYRTGDTAPGSTGNGTTDRRLDGTIGSDMAIDNASLVATGTLALTAWSYNAPS